jgi:RHS repeat-associated protein
VSTLNLTYSGWNLIEERNAWGQLEQVYAHGAGIDELLLKITSGPAAYYHHDGLGSTIALTGENGELLESYRYDAFGAVTILSPSTLDPRPSTAFGNRFLFTGREWLSQVGLYDYRNRVYSAQIGRFLQTDPIRFSAGDVNIYRYCGNEPVNSVDPMGLCKKLPKPGDGPTPPRTPTPPGPGGGGGGGSNIPFGVPAGGDIINSLQSAWNNNGSIDVSLSGGNLRGGSLTLSLSRGGFSVTPQVGLGFGFGASITANSNLGNQNGYGFGVTGSFGNGRLGGQFSGGTSIGGNWLQGGVGVGIGAGVSAGFNYTWKVSY